MIAIIFPFPIDQVDKYSVEAMTDNDLPKVFTDEIMDYLTKQGLPDEAIDGLITTTEIELIKQVIARKLSIAFMHKSKGS